MREDFREVIERHMEEMGRELAEMISSDEYDFRMESLAIFQGFGFRMIFDGGERNFDLVASHPVGMDVEDFDESAEYVDW